MSLSLAPTAEETISEPSEYEVMRSKRYKQKRTMLLKPDWKRFSAIRSKQWSTYMSEEDLTVYVHTS
mgnify:CR=1 FL=1